MDQTKDKHALQVCKTCKARKKRCDKTLPECEHCRAHSLVCEYEDGVLRRGRTSNHHSHEKWRQWNPTRSTESKTSDGNACHSNQIPPSCLSSVLPIIGNDKDLGNSLWIQVQDVFKGVTLSLDEVANRFFGGVFTWLPIIHPQSFRKRLLQFLGETPAPEITLLLLAMSLIVIHPLECSSRSSSIDLDDLYRITKSTFAHVQATTDISATMIQTSVLIAAYEYACGRLQAAYISIGVSSRMGQIIGLDQHNPKFDTGCTDLQFLERRNIWWGLIILERCV